MVRRMRWWSSGETLTACDRGRVNGTRVQRGRLQPRDNLKGEIYIWMRIDCQLGRWEVKLGRTVGMLKQQADIPTTPTCRREVLTLLAHAL
jgi:hypothetical protein